MEAVLGTVEKVNSAVNGVVWGPPMLVLFLLVGIYMSVGTGFFQIFHFVYTVKNTIFAIFKNKSIVKTEDKKAISQFQALATALAATVGTGNIVGVATAITAGGAGAVFWMWVSAFFGMMTSYSENVLGIFFRQKNKNGDWSGGPMYYIEKGLNKKWLACIFSVFCLLASFGIGSLAQVNGISTAMAKSFKVPGFITGIVVCALVGLIILGGLKRIVNVTEKFVPVMALFYITGTLIVIIANYKNVGAAFFEIFSSAFSLKSVGSGVFGYAITRSMKFGVARGVFSNEAGLGSSVMVHSSSDTKEPVIQGMWGIFQVFFDTVIICTLTALTILTTGADKVAGLEGVNITMYAFRSVMGKAGEYIVSTGIIMFAFSTILGWSVYGTRAAEYLGGRKLKLFYRIVFLTMVFIGSVSSVQLVWDLSDTFNGLMAIPNLIGVIFLSGTVFKITKNYKQRKLCGKNISPLISFHQNDLKTFLSQK